ncbi:MAG: hypothetical protein ABI862_11315 [Ilumatobacteraceae bacterium]
MKKYAYPSLNRRDLVKVGLFAGAPLSMPLSRVVAGQSAGPIGPRPERPTS